LTTFHVRQKESRAAEKRAFYRNYPIYIYILKILLISLLLLMFLIFH